MPHDVFISHSKGDKLTALALCNKLESSGVRCWIAPRDVAPGVEWGAAIIEAIEGSRVMVLIFSLKANNSKHVHREVHRAFAKNLTVIPIRVENAKPSGTLEYYLGSVHWLDAMTPPLEQHLETVARQVKALLLPPAVLESATRLAAERPPPSPQSISQPPASRLEVQIEPSEVQREPDRELPSARMPGPALSATNSSPGPREEGARNIESRVRNGPRIRQKDILVNTALLVVLHIIVICIAAGGGLNGYGEALWFGTLILPQIFIFYRIGSKIQERRWSHLLIVAIGSAVVMAIICAFFLPHDFKPLGAYGFFELITFLSMGAGGALSAFARRPDGKRRSPLVMVVAAVGILIVGGVIVIGVLSLFRS